MRIFWNIKHRPKPACTVSCYKHSDVKRMKQNIEKQHTVNITVSYRTKTSVSISLWYDDDTFTVAHIPVGGEKFKYVEQYFDGVFDSGMRYYFRISKKQGMTELKEYLTMVLTDMNLSVDSLNVNLSIVGVDALAEQN